MCSAILDIQEMLNPLPAAAIWIKLVCQHRYCIHFIRSECLIKCIVLPSVVLEPKCIACVAFYDTTKEN